MFVEGPGFVTKNFKGLFYKNYTLDKHRRREERGELGLAAGSRDLHVRRGEAAGDGKPERGVVGEGKPERGFSRDGKPETAIFIFYAAK